MITLRIGFLCSTLMVLLAGFITEHGQAKADPTPTSPALSSAVAQEYTHPHQLVDVGDDRKINLFCMGSGEPTVIFDSGLSDWSVIWALIQPTAAKRSRACTYDRAGMGYSGVAVKAPARFSAEMISDLHALIHAAVVKTPIVLVGHSLGGFNAKLYAAIYPDDVAGLVLVDPFEDREYTRTTEAVAAKYGAAISAENGLASIIDGPRAVAKYGACAAAADKRPLDPNSDLYKQCTDPVRTSLGPLIAAERQKIQISAAYQDTQSSELANGVFNDRFDPVYARLFAGNLFGDKPLIVLTHSIHDSTDNLAAADYYAWNLMHEQTAALSTRGVNRIVPGTHHNIEIDRPQAVIDAINEVLDSLKAN